MSKVNESESDESESDEPESDESESDKSEYSDREDEFEFNQMIEFIEDKDIEIYNKYIDGESKVEIIDLLIEYFNKELIIVQEKKSLLKPEDDKPYISEANEPKWKAVIYRMSTPKNKLFYAEEQIKCDIKLLNRIKEKFIL